MKNITKLVAILMVLFSLNSYAMGSFDINKELAKDLKTSKGSKAKIDNLEVKTVILYFTASWCPPCNKFTPSVVKFLEANKGDVEVIVISRDRTKDAATSYLKKKKADDFHMILPGKVSDKISQDFGVRGIPSVFVVNKEGKVVSKDGVGPIYKSTKLPAD